MRGRSPKLVQSLRTTIDFPGTFSELSSSLGIRTASRLHLRGHTYLIRRYKTRANACQANVSKTGSFVLTSLIWRHFQLWRRPCLSSQLQQLWLQSTILRFLQTRPRLFSSVLRSMAQTPCPLVGTHSRSSINHVSPTASPAHNCSATHVLLALLRILHPGHGQMLWFSLDCNQALSTTTRSTRPTPRWSTSCPLDLWEKQHPST